MIKIILVSVVWHDDVLNENENKGNMENEYTCKAFKQGIVWAGWGSQAVKNHFLVSKPGAK